MIREASRGEVEIRSQRRLRKKRLVFCYLSISLSVLHCSQTSKLRYAKSHAKGPSPPALSESLNLSLKLASSSHPLPAHPSQATIALEAHSDAKFPDDTL